MDNRGEIVTRRDINIRPTSYILNDLAEVDQISRIDKSCDRRTRGSNTWDRNRRLGVRQIA